jgi:hypothetical protein
MTRIVRSTLLVAIVLAVPAAASQAQSGDHAGNDAAAAPSGLEPARQTDPNANLPGWTGRTFVLGSHSSIAGGAAATRMVQTGSYGRQR